MFSMTEGEMLSAWKIDAAKASALVKQRDNPAGYTKSAQGIHGASGGLARGISPEVARSICAVCQVIESGVRKSFEIRRDVAALLHVHEGTANQMIRRALDRGMIEVTAKGFSPVKYNYYGLTDAGREFLAKNRGQV